MKNTAHSALLSSEAKSTSQQNSQQTQVEAPINTPDIELQTKCANAASLYFNKEKTDLTYMQDYQSHWNRQQNKCFIKISSSYRTDRPGIKSENGVDLYDAIEGVFYGSLLRGDSSVINFCAYGKSDGDGHGMKKCSTSDEFDTYMASIMNN